jgi:hypothetical protein
MRSVGPATLRSTLLGSLSRVKEIAATSITRSSLQGRRLQRSMVPNCWSPRRPRYVCVVLVRLSLAQLMAADDQSKTTEMSNLGEIFYRVFSGGLRIRAPIRGQAGSPIQITKSPMISTDEGDHKGRPYWHS